MTSTRRLAAALGCAALLGAGMAGAGTAGAAPVFVKKATAVRSGVYIEIRTYSQGGTRCKINLLARVYKDSRPIRSVGGHGRQSVNGCSSNTNWNVTIPARLARGGRYVVCVRAANNNDYGEVIAHTSCRRFRA